MSKCQIYLAAKPYDHLVKIISCYGFVPSSSLQRVQGPQQFKRKKVLMTSTFQKSRNCLLSDPDWIGFADPFRIVFTQGRPARFAARGFLLLRFCERARAAAQQKSRPDFVWSA
jgi:hypothetical protein